MEDKLRRSMQVIEREGRNRWIEVEGCGSRGRSGAYPAGGSEGSSPPPPLATL